MKITTKAELKQIGIGTIPQDWGVGRLSELVFRITKGTTPTTVGGRFTKEGVNFVKVESLRDDGTIDKEHLVHIDDETDRLLSRSRLQPDDILYSIAGTIGRVFIVRKDILPANTNQAVAIVRPNPNKVNVTYLRYALAAPAIKDYLSSKVVHAVQPNLSLGEISNCPIPIPSPWEQAAIARILSDIDSKIELNRQMNKSFEAIGKALFKHWFVDFEFPNEEGEPYRSLGGEMAYNEEFRKEIPKDWKIEQLRGLLKSIESGRRPKGGIDQTLTDGIPSIGAENINGLGFYDYPSTKYVSKEYFSQMKQGIVNDRDVLLYKDGAQLGRKSIFGKGFPFNTCCVNEHVFILRTNERLNQLYLYFWLDQAEVTENIRNLNANSAQPGINKESVGILKVLVPDRRVLNDFEGKIDGLIDRIFTNCLESRSLSLIRDSLLPKLMSGKIRVPVEVR